ncbi:MAG: aminoacyl-tRNA hydrolase [Myxococcales bacterium]|nr:aminoacyl-tRNA hydrolase [Myxococcales bacterium]
MKLVVGLGNPGTQYARNRHNVGFMVVDHLASAFGFPTLRDKFSGLWSKGTIAGEDVVLLQPMTFMNESGKSVQAAVAFFRVDAKSADELLVIHDELDIPFADVRLKAGGGHAGHNGLRSIMGVCGGEFARVRVGIGRPPPGFRGEVADYVLSNFDSIEAATLPDLLTKSKDAVTKWIQHGARAAQNEGSAKPKKKAS